MNKKKESYYQQLNVTHVETDLASQQIIQYSFPKKNLIIKKVIAKKVPQSSTTSWVQKHSSPEAKKLHAIYAYRKSKMTWFSEVLISKIQQAQCYLENKYKRTKDIQYILLVHEKSPHL